MTREYKCVSDILIKYFFVAAKLLFEFNNVIIQHVPKEFNQEANDLAQIASKYKLTPTTLNKLVEAKQAFVPLEEREVCLLDRLYSSYWRMPNVEYLKNPNTQVDMKIKYHAISYIIVGDTLFKKSVNGNLLTFLRKDDAYLALAEVHEGMWCLSSRIKSEINL